MFAISLLFSCDFMKNSDLVTLGFIVGCRVNLMDTSQCNSMQHFVGKSFLYTSVVFFDEIVTRDET